MATWAQDSSILLLHHGKAISWGMEGLRVSKHYRAVRGTEIKNRTLATPSVELLPDPCRDHCPDPDANWDCPVLNSMHVGPGEGTEISGRRRRLSPAARLGPWPLAACSYHSGGLLWARRCRASASVECLPEEPPGGGSPGVLVRGKRKRTAWALLSVSSRGSSSDLASARGRVDKDRSGVISDTELQQALSNEPPRLTASRQHHSPDFPARTSSEPPRLTASRQHHSPDFPTRTSPWDPLMDQDSVSTKTRPETHRKSGPRRRELHGALRAANTQDTVRDGKRTTPYLEHPFLWRPQSCTAAFTLSPPWRDHPGTVISPSVSSTVLLAHFLCLFLIPKTS
ncbi:uncharacterized protein [Chlorocebus sabaeus]|uniref:uncharacterized protein n=1 Tax=Chlorocebus sabaeus TaxID=60711 RepID=UPI003BF94F08